MVLKSNYRKYLLSGILLVGLLNFSGCSSVPFLAPPTPTPTDVPPTETPIPSPTPIPPTATPIPTNTAIPTETPTATPLPPLAVVPDGINPWCLTKKYFTGHIDGPYGPATMPDNATAGSVNKKTNVVNFPIPAVSCTLVLAFNQPVPAGMKLQIWDARPQEPFIEYDMLANPNNPNEAYGVMTHTYIVDPPKWWMDYTMVVVTTEGTQVFSAPMHVQKPLPEKCWDGSYPNPITLFCPIQDS